MFVTAGVVIIPICLKEKPVNGQVKGAYDVSAPLKNTSLKPPEVYFIPPGLQDISEIALSLNTTIYPQDEVNLFPPPSYYLGSKLTINRATPVTIIDANVRKLYRSWRKTVKDIFLENQIEVGDKDRVEPGIDAQLTWEQEIKIIRVTETSLSKENPLSYKSREVEDATLDKGVQRVKEPGQEGIERLTYRVIRENGLEVKRKLVSREVIRQPKDRIVLIGTKVVVLGEGTATWYDWISGLSAASNTLPYGTQVVVTNLANGKSVTVKIIDHGIKGGAIIDLSSEAFSQIANLSQGVIRVRLTKP